MTPGEVRIWRAIVPAEAHPSQSLVSLVAEDEVERAGRFRFDADRGRFLYAHAMVRDVLSRVLDRPAAQIRFETGSHGKPFLTEGPRFNLSHSGERVLLAISDLEVGVDVESVRAKPDLMGVANRFFSSREIAELQALPEALRTQAFFRCWARKEAYIKGLGFGLAQQLNRFSVSSGAGDPELVGGEPGWSVREVDAGTEYAAAVAAQAPEFEVYMADWTPRID
jgi:4'-phosphopantetheinyl transferase